MHAVSACNTLCYVTKQQEGPCPPPADSGAITSRVTVKCTAACFFNLVYSQGLYYSNRLREGSKQKEERLNKILKTDDLEENTPV